MEINNYLYSKALDKALKVKFLTSREELFLYAGALYSAMMWGRGIDEKDETIQRKDKSVKSRKSQPTHDYEPAPHTIMMQIYYLLLK